MLKKLIYLFGGLFAGLAILFLQFGGVAGFAASWYDFTNGSTWIPFSAYGNRVEDISKLRRFETTHVVFEDQSLFWKGIGAVAVPQLNKEGELEQLVITSSGSGYGSVVKARISGAGAEQFEMGEVTVRNGRILAIEILKTGKWYDSPRMFVQGDQLPFSGTAQIKYRNGQLMESRKYLEGELHGKWSKWKYNGIPLFEKDYVRGLKHGTHMHWYGNPIDPNDYKVANENAYASLWLEVNEKAKQEFEGQYLSQESNDWMIETYKDRGGSLGPKLHENYAGNRRHGSCEGFDEYGQTIFKDEYTTGRRTSHQSLDPGRKWKSLKRLSAWVD